MSTNIREIQGFLTTDTLPKTENADDLVKETAKTMEKSAQDGLEQIESIKSSFPTIDENIAKLVKLSSTNQSIISQWAEQWGNTTTTGRTLTAMTYVGPPLLMGMILNVPVLIVAAGMTGLSGAGASYILDNHYQSTKMQQEQAGQVVTAIKEVLVKIASECDNILNKFAAYIQFLKITSADLTHSSKIISKEITTLMETHKASQETTALLDKKKDELSAEMKRLHEATEGNAELIKLQNETLKKVIAESEASHKVLNESIVKLQKAYEQSQAEKEKTQKTLETLTQVMELMTKAQKAQGVEGINLESLVENNNNISIQIFQQKIQTQQSELDTLKQELGNTRDGFDVLYRQYADLMQQQADQIERQEKQIEKQTNQNQLLSNMLSQISGGSAFTTSIYSLFGTTSQSSQPAITPVIVTTQKNEFVCEPLPDKSEDIGGVEDVSQTALQGPT